MACLYTGDRAPKAIDFRLRVETVSPGSVSSVTAKVRRPDGSTMDWPLDITGTETGAVLCRRVLEQDDLTIPGAYRVRLFGHDGGSAVIVDSCEASFAVTKPTHSWPA